MLQGDIFGFLTCQDPLSCYSLLPLIFKRDSVLTFKTTHWYGFIETNNCLRWEKSLAKDVVLHRALTIGSKRLMVIYIITIGLLEIRKWGRLRGNVLGSNWNWSNIIHIIVFSGSFVFGIFQKWGFHTVLFTFDVTLASIIIWLNQCMIYSLWCGRSLCLTVLGLSSNLWTDFMSISMSCFCLTKARPKPKEKQSAVLALETSCK